MQSLLFFPPVLIVRVQKCRGRFSFGRGESHAPHPLALARAGRRGGVQYPGRGAHGHAGLALGRRTKGDREELRLSAFQPGHLLALRRASFSADLYLNTVFFPGDNED